MREKSDRMRERKGKKRREREGDRRSEWNRYNDKGGREREQTPHY